MEKFFANSSPEEIKKNQDLINTAINSDETLGQHQEIEMGAFAKTFNEEEGVQAEKLFFNPIKERIHELYTQIEMLQKEIEGSSGTNDLMAFQGIIMQKSELEKYASQISKEIEALTERQKEDPINAQKIQQLELVQGQLNMLTHHIDELSPTMTPETESKLEEQLEALRTECAQFETFFENIQAPTIPGSTDRPINYN